MKWWLANRPTLDQLVAERCAQDTFPKKPLISILVPVYNVDPKWLDSCFESLRSQSYDRWEICAVDDCSTNPETIQALIDWPMRDSRVRIWRQANNSGIAGATQKCLEMARGEFIGLLDNDDELAANALHQVVKIINEHPDADFIYSDEDKIDDEGLHMDPFFKPDWSNELLLTMMYTCHFTVYRTELVRKADAFPVETAGSQDHDLAFKMSELAKGIYHIPKILYHWRILPESSASRPDAKDYAVRAQKLAIETALKRRGVEATVEKGVETGRWRIRYALPNPLPKVTLLLLTGGKMEFLEPCLESIFSKTTYSNYEVLVVDNSVSESVRDYLAQMQKQHPQLRVQRNDLKPFNFSALCNEGARTIESPYLILLNDDVTIVTPDWIEAMMEYGQRKDAGMVGCKLLYPNDVIQHAGTVFGVWDNVGHFFRGVANGLNWSFDLPHVAREVLAVTFACALMRTELYWELGGLDEDDFKLAFNDVDLCIKAVNKGLTNFYTPYAVLYHYESVTKEAIVLHGEVEEALKRWGKWVEHDPYYNPNLAKRKEDWTLDFDNQPPLDTSHALQADLYRYGWRGPEELAMLRKHFGKVWGDLASSNAYRLHRLFSRSPRKRRGPELPPAESLELDAKDLNYRSWWHHHYPLGTELEAQRKAQVTFTTRPLISLLIRLDNISDEALHKCLESIAAQTYPEWEACLIGNGCETKATRERIEWWRTADSRIHAWLPEEKSGRALASRRCVAMARGGYFALLSASDCLAPNALHEVVLALNTFPEGDFVYTDEDQIDEEGNHANGVFKPDWSPEYMLSKMYTGKLQIFRNDLARRADAFPDAVEGSEDYDLALQMSEQARSVTHIPKVLCHAAPRDAADDEASRKARRTALERALERRGTKATVEDGEAAGTSRVRYALPDNAPKVTILMLTGGKIEFLAPCLESIFSKTTYPNYEILLVDNSMSPIIRDYLDGVKKANPGRFRVQINNLKPFNFSALCNDGAKTIDSPFLLLLNDDVSIITPDWIESMMEFGQREDVGVVGCKLLYPNELLQHAGVHLGVYGLCGHYFKAQPNDPDLGSGLPHVAREVLAVTFACALMRTKLYWELGGLNDDVFKIAYNDVDMCIKAIRKGYKNIYTPYAKLYHFESVTKEVHRLEGEIEAAVERWSDLIEHDPYYNPNLTRTREDHTVDAI
jgi:GT2 family glycosyltransferase